MTTNGRRRPALALDVPTVTGHIHDRSGGLLDELDDLIAALDATLADQAAARLAIADAEAEQAIIEASLMLATEGRNETERKARLALALHANPGYQELCRVARDGRATLFACDRRTVVIKERCRLVRAALALLAPA